MNHYAKGVVRVEKDIISRVKRTLAGKGLLSVAVGQEVTPDELLGRAEVSAGFRIMNLSSLLTVSPADVEKYLARKLGQKIYKGELLASKTNWLFPGKKIITSPTDGVLDFLNSKTGDIKISFLPKKKELPAGVYGIVEEVDKERGQVIIRTQVTIVHGVLGSGRSRDGILHIISKKDEMVSKSLIKPEFEGYILAGGSLFFKDTISSAISAGATGIITGGINAVDFQGIAGGRLIFPRRLDNDIGISVVACEGFGSIPIGTDIFEILADYEGMFVFIDGNKASINLPSFSSSSMAKIKSTKLPSLQKEELGWDKDKASGVVELKTGLKVRIVGISYLGEQGKLIKLDSSPTLLPSGVKAYLATIETQRRKIQVPVANLEVMV